MIWIAFSSLGWSWTITNNFLTDVSHAVGLSFPSSETVSCLRTRYATQVNLHYSYSPAIADLIWWHHIIRVLVRIALPPLIKLNTAVISKRMLPAVLPIIFPKLAGIKKVYNIRLLYRKIDDMHVFEIIGIPAIYRKHCTKKVHTYPMFQIMLTRHSTN